MQLVFTPDLGSSTTLAAAPGSVVQLAARVSTHDYEQATAAGTFVEIWSDLPRPGAPTGEWGATPFVPAPTAPEHHDAGAPPTVLSLLPADPEPVPTSSAAPETTLLVASFVVPQDTDSVDYQFTYRLAHTNDSGSWHTWLGDSGSNGHIIIKPDAPPIEGLVFASPWNTTDNVPHSPPDGTVASLAGPIEWSGWALDLDSNKESAATPQRFASLPADLSATHLALFPTPSLTALNPASHTPVLLSTTSRLSLSNGDLSAHGSPIRLAPLSRSALESSLPEHVALLPESAASAPYVVLHDTRGSSLSILPIAPTAPGTQVVSLNLEKVAAAAPAKTLIYSSTQNTAALCTPELRVAVTPLGGDIQVCDVYAVDGETGEWEAGLVGGTKVQPEPEPIEEEEAESEHEQEPEAVVEATPAPAPAPAPVEPTKVAPPPIQTTTNTIPHAQESPITPETARTPHPSNSTVTPAKRDHNRTVLQLIQGVAAAVMWYVTHGAWSMFGWGFRMFGVGLNAAPKSKTPEHSPIPAVEEESESDSETNEVAPTPIDPTHVSSAPVVVVGPSTSGSNPGPGPKDGVNMPLTPPMSPKTTVPFVIPGPEPKVKKNKVKFAKPAPKPKIAFTAPTSSTLVVLSEAHVEPVDKLKLSVAGETLSIDKLNAVTLVGGTGKAWAAQIGGENKVEVGLV
ncbi:hypothetical protein RhiJN_14719 [Ceratobasidium sp. AG-Ba]|nr:hypothetical protein RhiJN_14719 [Ceratobasidium sp. AG-Ba]